jgi:hypothetical protein
MGKLLNFGGMECGHSICLLKDKVKELTELKEFWEYVSLDGEDIFKIVFSLGWA